MPPRQGCSLATLDFPQAASDPGWFGPESITWRLHADFIVMMIGGIASLLLQALHPLVLAAVWDYSEFRDNLLNRLHRTALFIATTTYGPSDAAQAAIERVRAIHAKVQGMGPDGRAYAADDSHLLTFIHVTEIHSIVSAFDWLKPTQPTGTPCTASIRIDSSAQRVDSDTLSALERDTYVAEMACVPQALGAFDVPRDWPTLVTRLESYRPEMQGHSRPQAILRMLRNMTRHHQSRPFTEAAVQRLLMALGGRVCVVPLDWMMNAAIALLPPWARVLYALPPDDPHQLATTRTALRATASVLRWSLRNGIATQARQRMAGDA